MKNAERMNRSSGAPSTCSQAGLSIVKRPSSEIVASKSLVSSNSRAMRASSAPRVCARGEAPWTSARATDSLLLVAGCMLANHSTPRRPFPDARKGSWTD